MEASLPLLHPNRPNEPFPPVSKAWKRPNGLLAVGGDLSLERLKKAYADGIFPWYSEGEPIYWWAPDPRAVIFPDQIKISRSLRKSIRNRGYRIAFDQQFEAVVSACAEPRIHTEGTWITTEMYQAYCKLAQEGIAHSIEIYNQEDQLVGGLYGVSAGAVFSGESMFAKAPDASKMAAVALAYCLKEWGFLVIDCQMPNPHLTSLGAVDLSRDDFMALLHAGRGRTIDAPWQMPENVDLSRWDPAN